MTDFLRWLAEGGEQLTVVGILIIALFVIVYGVQKDRRWWVPGWMYTECLSERDSLRTEVQRYVEQTEDRLERLESLSTKGRGS